MNSLNWEGLLWQGTTHQKYKKKFKMILIKMKNNKMISLSEFNEILTILIEMDY
jgi:hypothetical protein